jgi:hypothetical protein
MREWQLTKRKFGIGSGGRRPVSAIRRIVQKNSARIIIFTNAVTLIFLTASVAIKADPDPRSAGDSPGDILEKYQSSQLELPIDSGLAIMKIGNVSYRIPRNYIIALNPDSPVLKVAYPGFKPPTEEVRECSDPKRRDALSCTTIEIHLRLPLPNKPRFDNLMKLVPSEQKLSPQRSVHGYDVYHLAQQEIYRSESDDIFFTCKRFDNSGERDAICDDIVKLDDGNAAWFFFRLRQISEVRKIEAGIRELMSRFEN